MTAPPTPAPDAAQGASTLVEVLAVYEARGHVAQLVAQTDGMVKCHHCGQSSDAARLDVQDEHRLEGASDPDDMALVMATKCPQCRTPATLVVHFGPGAGEEDADVVLRLRGEV